jgi:hypothetical protein
MVTGCATYHLSTQSLIVQLANTQPERKVNVIIALPLFFRGEVMGNSLKEVSVLDKNDKEVVLPVTRHMGIRITQKDGKRNTFYFDTLILRDSLITGKKDHFFGINLNPINLNNVQKIELQR